jgi:hypothetical protein
MTRKFDSTTGPILSDVDHIVHAIAAHFRGRRATPEAVLWPNAQDLMHRFHALTRAIEWANFSDNSRLHLLDLGCGEKRIKSFCGALADAETRLD